MRRGGVKMTVSGPEIEAGELGKGGKGIGQNAGAVFEQGHIEFGAQSGAAGAGRNLAYLGLTCPAEGRGKRSGKRLQRRIAIIGE